MKWSDVGIVLSLKTYGESSRIVKVFTAEQGRYGGIIKGSKNTQYPGNIVNATWNARLPDHMGNWSLETDITPSARFLGSMEKLSCLSSLCYLTDSCLPERHPYPFLYEKAINVIYALLDCPLHHWLYTYFLYEFSLLEELGFGLDLSKCAVTGTTSNLIYVSPKTARAVCEEVGRPYHEKLLPLPSFMVENQYQNPVLKVEDIKKPCS